MQRKLKERQSKQKVYYDRQTKLLPDLQPGEKIRMQNGESWQPAVVQRRHEHPRPFVVRTPDGNLFKRNRKHLRKTKDTDKSVFDKSIIKVDPFTLTVMSKNDSIF